MSGCDRRRRRSARRHRGVYLHAGIATIIGLVTLLLAVLFGRVLSSRVARRLSRSPATSPRSGRSISRDPAPRSFVREVSEFGASVDRMKASLRSFAHYVPTDLVRTLLGRGQRGRARRRDSPSHRPLSRRRRLHRDLRGWTRTRWSRRWARYLDLMTGAISRHSGTVDDFIGDGIMAFFNAPEELLGHRAGPVSRRSRRRRCSGRWPRRHRPASRCFAPISGWGSATCWSAISARPSAFLYAARRQVRSGEPARGPQQTLWHRDHRLGRGDATRPATDSSGAGSTGLAVKGRTAGAPRSPS